MLVEAPEEVVLRPDFTQDLQTCVRCGYRAADLFGRRAYSYTDISHEVAHHTSSPPIDARHSHIVHDHVGGAGRTQH